MARKAVFHENGVFDAGDGTITIPAASHVHAGEDITSGSVADARIASTIARDSEVTSAISALASVYQAKDTSLDYFAGLDPSANVKSVLSAADYAAIRTLLGLVIGTNVQAYDADLTTYASITPSANVQSVLGAADYAAIRTLLGLVIGTNVQAWDADLDAIAALGVTNDSIIQGKAGAWAKRTIAQLLTDLAAAGTTFQPLDPDLTTIAGLTPTTDNFMVAASSAWASRTPAQAKTALALVKGDVGLGNVDNTADTGKPVSTAQQTALNLKADLASPALTGSPTVPTQTAGDNSTKAASTAYARAAAGLGVYKTLFSVAGSHIAGKVAGTYGLGFGDPLAVSGTGTLYPLGVFYIASADYPNADGLAAKLRIRAQLAVNDVAPTGNFTIGLHPITRPGTSGAAGLNIYTIGTVVAGSNGATFTAPAADSHGQAVGSDFSLPADGLYILAVVTTQTVATSSLVHINAHLQMHHA